MDQAEGEGSGLCEPKLTDEDNRKIDAKDLKDGKA